MQWVGCDALNYLSVHRDTVICAIWNSVPPNKRDLVSRISQSYPEQKEKPESGRLEGALLVIRSKAIGLVPWPNYRAYVGYIFGRQGGYCLLHSQSIISK
jgi:hypothetical protein